MMGDWTKPLTEEDIVMLTQSNVNNGPVERIAGPIGILLKLVCSRNPDPIFHNKVYYCGGTDINGHVGWLTEPAFFATHPEYDPAPKMTVDMELDEIHLAEQIMEGLMK